MKYFKGVDAQKKYDNFFEKVLKVKDVAVLTFADEDLVLERTTEDQYQLLDALDLYELFHYVRRETDWGKFPFACICKWCCKWII